ncbi:hypothetical protein LX32DRAFT_636957 [Colletotrichum zoysiae]|uniref:Uncharacterized protein n=1 Tax=Colletotrichum zoysiae TaxID=1216348 RepID=A0AAD9M3G5_9PEZI|nr:hypothetical protein LX32DRAFT_636957 [Colletotrichum zoysiae]
MGPTMTSSRQAFGAAMMACLVEVLNLRRWGIAVDRRQDGEGRAETNHIRVPADTDVEDSTSGGWVESGGCAADGGGVNVVALAGQDASQLQKNHESSDGGFCSIGDGFAQGGVDALKDEISDLFTQDWRRKVSS